MVALLGLKRNVWKNVRWELHKNVVLGFDQILEASANQIAAVWPLYRKTPKKDKQCILDTIAETKIIS